MDRITIIGMGPIGVSIGLGLKRTKMPNTEVVGADGDKKALAVAYKMGAIDERSGNLRKALDGAQLVVIDSLTPNLKELIQSIGPVLADGCVLTDTGKDKVQVMKWAANYLNPKASFVGGRPLPRQALETIEDARETVFEGTNYCVIPTWDTHPEAVETVVGMVEALGAVPFFVDPEEHDSFTAAAAHLPQLLSAALVNVLADDPAWKETARMAGSEFLQMSTLAGNDPDALAESSKRNQASTTRWVDAMITELSALKTTLCGDSDQFRDALVRASEHRTRWMTGAEDENVVQPITSGESMASMIFGSRLVERYKLISALRDRSSRKHVSDNSRQS